MEVRIVKDLEVSGERRGIREERNDKEFSPQRTERAQRWVDEGERINPREEESNAETRSTQRLRREAVCGVVRPVSREARDRWCLSIKAYVTT